MECYIAIKNLLIIPSAFNPLDFSYNHYGRITFYKDKKGYIQSNITGHGGILMQYTGLHDCKKKQRNIPKDKRFM